MRKYTVNPARPPGRKSGDVAALAKAEGISRQAAWYRLRKATGKPRGRPKKEATNPGQGIGGPCSLPG